MAPAAINEPPRLDVAALKAAAGPQAPVVDLRSFAHFNNTPGIGTEFRAAGDYRDKSGKPILALRDILDDPASLRALGRLVSERGVVFFRDADISTDEQLKLVHALGLLGGKPETSGLHVNPCTAPGQKEGDEVARISNNYVFGEKFKRDQSTMLLRRVGKLSWHSDITYEPVPSDYACLTIRTVPETGGDTLWASAYDAFDRLSPPMRKFLEGLTALHKGVGFIQLARKFGIPEFRENRGSPENVGQALEAVHPVVRTHPITGWKGLFVNREFTQRIVELTPYESDQLLEFLFNHISDNQDIQVRFRWEPHSVAIWDNRCTFHTATFDLDNNVREGTRGLSLGEKPYLDPNSLTRREALEKQGVKPQS
ncbi:putative taurine dioxygenase [Cutaneotrichosporon oleaginosum]|uniref:Putative taurine dioxygenase n=1 Tax=Cutaneotrichosporon oleaginosum TaxID=879819 RepID=A0A0J0XIU6_9TREE|nr:putative taurine dioxygenase [Cutaneotrichosporon oleaginosum]KLT41001.1 putative taurine dioxygenase [Cutaneotrichosporon oleaginosum]